MFCWDAKLDGFMEQIWVIGVPWLVTVVVVPALVELKLDFRASAYVPATVVTCVPTWSISTVNASSWVVSLSNT